MNLRLTRAAARAVRRGHPWVFEASVTHQSRAAKSGEVAVLYDPGRAFVGAGLFDADDRVRVRVLARGKPQTIDAAFIAARLAEAAARRAPLAARDTDGFRVVHGEGDGLGGLVVDKYADTFVIKLYSAAWFGALDGIADALAGLYDVERVIVRLSRALARLPARARPVDEGALLRGAPPPGPLVFRERGLRFYVDPWRGQKTGFFLDQRENRARVEALSAGRTVLNVFSYSGGFSLYAARGGARAVTSLDQSGPALRDAERNFVLNAEVPPVAACAHATLRADAFAALAELGAAGRSFDVVVIDPPSFAKRAAEVAGALSSYRRLLRGGLSVLAPGGTLVFASCSSRVTAAAFFDALRAEAAAQGRPLQVVETSGHALDHPLCPGFEEGAYLKCLFARVP